MDKTAAKHSRLGLIVAWCAALGFAAAALKTKWLLFPLSRQLRGIDFALGPYTPGSQHPHLASFGCVAALLLLAGAVFFTLRWWRALGCAGVLLLWLAVLAPLKATLLDATLLQTLAVEVSQGQLATAFTQQALPVNFGSEPTAPSKLNLVTVEDRWLAAWQFAHGGWWAVVFGGLLALIYSVRIAATDTVSPMRPISSMRLGVITVTGAAIILIVSSLKPALAEIALMRAHSAEARGDLNAAERAYRTAMRLDGWQALDIDNYSALGCLDEAREYRSTPEYHVYHAQLPSTQIDVTASLGEFERIHTDDATLAQLIRRRESELYAAYARQLHALDAYGAAVTASENALERDPNSLLAGYYLSRDFYMIGSYTDAAALSMKLATSLDDPTFRANLFGNAGDAYTEMRAYELAKEAYRKSYLYDYVLNLRALSALNGPGEDLQ